jgi:hypothetical protein
VLLGQPKSRGTVVVSDSHQVVPMTTVNMAVTNQMRILWVRVRSARAINAVVQSAVARSNRANIIKRCVVRTITTFHLGELWGGEMSLAGLLRSVRRDAKAIIAAAITNSAETIRAIFKVLCGVNAMVSA